MTDVLVAGIGNILMGDDGFGVEVVRRLGQAGAAHSGGVRFVDFGIRGFDLAFALSGGCAAAILVDAAQRGKEPGTLTVLEPHEFGSATAVETHGMHPLHALELARTLGGVPSMIRIVACEPETLGSEEFPVMGLSARVEAAVPVAMGIVTSLLAQLEPREAPHA